MVQLLILSIVFPPLLANEVSIHSEEFFLRGYPETLSLHGHEIMQHPCGNEI